MKAENGKTYAQILRGRVHWLFTKDELPEWADDAFEVIDVTGMDIQVGWVKTENGFTPNEIPALNYQMQRFYEYPPITEYIDGVVKGDQAQVQKYIDECLAVKAKYPKGTS